MQEHKVLLCGGQDFARARNITTEHFARVFCGHDDAWAALYAALCMGKPVRFPFNDASYFIAAYDPALENRGFKAFTFEGIDLERLRPVAASLPVPLLAPPDPPAPRAERMRDARDDHDRPLSGKRRVWFRLNLDEGQMLAFATIDDCESDAAAEIWVRDNLGAFLPELQDRFDNAVKGVTITEDQLEYSHVEYCEGE